MPWHDVVGFRRQGRDLDVPSLRLGDGSEVPLTVPGDQLAELLAYAPSRLRDAEVRHGSRTVEIRRGLRDAGQA
ncbi:hypothetical protein AVL62_06190 [Serinicoccus chungangensis]|uniref:Uncharacterized protein n=1 Tax=Serinicoccus chungangensis TaxID=767452 RepID=A0A0W8IH99_9MICO|nr:hypothetical protein [Serinicoccus chungangensis]KUG59269.1 hypothetical protein AVL62_06190 [Serinicoccus chungangensis]